MITIKNDLLRYAYVLQPTIFPDGTSQVWKLPQEILDDPNLSITWNFEAEREIIDLLSLRELLPNHRIHLHIPYLPYARQDKEVSNATTFNLEVLAQLLNMLVLDKVTSVDVHNPDRAYRLIDGFENISAYSFLGDTINKTKPDYIVFPDQGARMRYIEMAQHYDHICCDKVRDQLTGNILSHEISVETGELRGDSKMLIIDDICDGGATFISVAKTLREEYGKKLTIDLCVTHGIFSRGKTHLLENGINNIYTTNSLIKNGDGFDV